MLLIIDNQSTYITELEERLKEWNIDYVKHHHSQPLNLDELTDIKGIILSGGSGNPYGPLNLTANYVALMNFNVPVIAFCLGHEIVATAYGGGIEKLSEEQHCMEDIVIDEKDPIFDSLNGLIRIQKKHEYHVVKLPKEFNILAHSGVCPIEVIKHKNKPIYGFQGHPEVSGEEGLMIIRNFLRMCGIKI